MASNVPFATGALATTTTSTDNLTVSVNDEQLSNSTNKKEASETQNEKEAASHVIKRIIVLLVCSENGCVSLIKTDVRLLISYNLLSRFKKCIYRN